MTAQTPGCGPNSEARKRAAEGPVGDNVHACGDRWGDMSCTLRAGHGGMHVDERVFGPVGDTARAEAAWLTYRDEYQRLHPWCDSRRAGRQMRKREFIAGYLAALSTPPAQQSGGTS